MVEQAPQQQYSNQQQTPPLESDAQVHVANQSQEPPKSRLFDKVKNFFAKLTKLQKILIFGGVGLFGLLLLLALVVAFMMNGGKGQTTVEPTPSATEMPQQTTPENLSKYATDEAVIKIKEDLDRLESDLQGLQVEETTLTPPSLDFDISF